MRINVSKLLNDLHNHSFFNDWKALGNVSQKLSSAGHNPSKASILMALKNAKYLRKEGKKGNYRFIQKSPPINDYVEVFYFEPGKPRTSRKNFIQILENLKGEVKICDPYLNEDTLDALEKIKNAKVKFLTSSKKSNVRVSNKDLIDFKSENPHMEINGFPFDHLHDRYIITSKDLFILGHGFSLRKKESFIIQLPEKIAKDLIQSLSVTFNTRWKNQNNKNWC